MSDALPAGVVVRHDAACRDCPLSSWEPDAAAASESAAAHERATGHDAYHDATVVPR